MRWGVRLGIPAVLGGVWLVVVLARLPLPYPSDQLNYFNAASAFPYGFPRPGAIHQVTRFGLVLPVRLAIDVFGYSEAAYHVVPLLATLTVLAATYALGTTLFTPVVGAASAVVVVTAMPMFTDAAALLPDAPAAGLFTIAAVLALRVRRGRRWPLLLIGVLLAWSYAIREFIVFAWPLIPVLLVRRGVPMRRLAWVAAPVVAYLGVEMLLCQALYGDPLARVHAILHQRLSPYPAYWGMPRAAYLVQLPVTLLHEPGGAWLTALLGALLLGALVWRRRLAVPLAWCALIWVPLTLSGGLIEPDDPALRLNLIRYWFPLFPPLAAGGIGVLWLAAAWCTARRARLAVAPAVVLAVAGFAAGTSVAAAGRDPVIGTDNGRAQMAAFRGWMTHHAGPGTLWTDSRTTGVAEVYRRASFGGRRWSNPVRPVTAHGPRPGPGDLVLFFDAAHGTVCGVCRSAEDGLWGDPPRPLPSWHPVFATRDDVVRVYRVGPSGSGLGQPGYRAGLWTQTVTRGRIPMARNARTTRLSDARAVAS